MTRYRAPDLHIKNKQIAPFQITRYDNGQKVNVTSETGIFVEKLGIGPGCLVHVGHGSQTFACIETVDEIKAMIQTSTLEDQLQANALAVENEKSWNLEKK